ncbi:MAG TPA: transposase [Thermoanaerobaculia bacterium]|nr:transposase [Thermoanaerobaculia bacterium]
MSKRKPEQAPKAEAPRCPFCGRRITVRRIEDRLYHCDHCQKMFQL